MKYQTAAVLSLCLGTLLGVTATTGAWAADLATLTGPCEDCHGKDGTSQEPKIPTIGGMSAVYITDSIAAFSEESRPCDEVKYIAGDHKGETSTMCKAVKDLSEADIEQLAEHYEGLPFVRARQTFDAELAAKGEEIHEMKCKKCHEDGGSSPDDDAGFLAGQWMPYLEEQFEEYGSGERPMPEKMEPKFKDLSEDDSKALIQYYGSFQ